MADGSPEDRAGPAQMNDLTFSASDPSNCDTKKCCEPTLDGVRLKLSFYTELDLSDSCENCETRGVVADRSVTTDSRKTPASNIEDNDDRKKRCFDRYDSSESSDSGVAVLSPTESSGCSGSDITEPRSPRSPESGCSTSEEGAGARMPPWASDPAPPGPRRLAAQPAPLRRPNPPIHRRITEYFNHKMKPQNGVKRESNSLSNDDTKKKSSLPKNGVTHDLEKYISYLSQTLNPKVLIDAEKQTDSTRKTVSHTTNYGADFSKNGLLHKTNPGTNSNGINSNGICSKPKDNKETHTMNGFVEVRHGAEPLNKDKTFEGFFNGVTVSRFQNQNPKVVQGHPAHMTLNINNCKVPIPSQNDLVGMRIAPAKPINQSPKTQPNLKTDSTKLNGVVSSTTKLDSRMNGVTCGSNNLNLMNTPSIIKNEPVKRNVQTKRTNRKSSACIANSKNLTWSKANNLKQIQLQKQNCSNLIQNSSIQNSPIQNSSIQNSSIQNLPVEANTAPKMHIPNGVRQVSMAVNGNLGNLNAPTTNFQNCHPINIPQPCNGTVTSTNLASFVAVPHNVMLTTLRIPQNGLPPQTLNQQGNMAAFNRQNVNVTSPTKLNGQFVFPLVQNINGTVVQIPNLMAKMPNFVLPQNPQITTQRQDHLQNQALNQFLINGTLLKLANTIPPTYTTTPNKAGPVTSQSIPVMNKNVPGLQAVGMTVQPKQNFTVNLSHPVLMPQPGFIVTSVPNMNVKETWSYTNTSSVPSSQISCSNNIVHHQPPIVANFINQNLHSSSIPIAPVKPPDNPIQGTEPPSSTVKEIELNEITNQKCDIPWLSKTVNNNILSLDSKKLSRPFAQVSSCSGNLRDFTIEKLGNKRRLTDDLLNDFKVGSSSEVRKVEDVARREDTIFTQITVLKDVSSNVQSTVIEANFCGATTESSESGIGTDKSIDSPSDSQASKECDDDSSLSLSISVSSIEAQSQKSPILKQPKTLRFPPTNVAKPQSDERKSSTDTTTVTVCLWEKCKQELQSGSHLLEHLQTVHVESQAGQENYVCLWERCKVRGKPSCSRLWLERHALSHGGNKPFKCIVDGCERRFSTQILLERHVNNHFNEASPNGGSGKKTTDSSSKLIRRNGKKLRYRRQPWSARMFDFFDSGMMEGLAWRLSRSTRWRLGGACPLREPAGDHTLTLHAALTATRYNPATAAREALLTYYPPHVVEDEWVPEDEVKRVKRVEISQLPAHTKVMLYEEFCNSYRKTPSPPPAKKTSVTSQPVRLLPTRQCTSSRLLNNLIAKQRKERNDCSATGVPSVFGEEEREREKEKSEVSGAKKRKMGRRYGGNAFWPCGR